MTTAGWYDDPRDAQTLRWWDGASWSDETHPRPAAPVSPGWYERPERPGVLDWWDGARWIDRDSVEILDVETFQLDDAVIDLRARDAVDVQSIDIREIPLDQPLGQPMVDEVVHHPAGWYADPVQPTAWRWWDGAAWTDHLHTAHAQAVPAL